MKKACLKVIRDLINSSTDGSCQISDHIDLSSVLVIMTSRYRINIYEADGFINCAVFERESIQSEKFIDLWAVDLADIDLLVKLEKFIKDRL